MSWPYISNGTPPTVVRSEGCYLYLEDGSRVLDACAGAIVTNIGHGRDEVVDAIQESTKTIGYTVPIWLTPDRTALMDRLKTDWLPADMTRIHLTSSGSEGIEAAIKMAILYQLGQGRPEKYKVIGRDISYHGITMTTISLGGHETRKRGLHHVLSKHPVAPTPYPLRCQDSNPAEYYVREFENVIVREGPETIAALVAEPISGASGAALVPPDGYWEGIQAICHEHDIVLIFDEVMTGFGRTATRWGYQHWDIQPDVIVSGKGLTGGYSPLTAVVSSAKIADSISEVGNIMFHTYSAFPPACAAANKVLEIIEREHLIERCQKMGKMLATKLQGAFSNHPHVAECRGRGLLQAVELVKDRNTLENFDPAANIASKVASTMLKNGVAVYQAGNGIVQDALLIGPPFTVEDHQLDNLVNVMSDAIDEVTLN